MKRIACAILLFASSVAWAKLDLIINLQVDREIFVRRISSSDDVLNKTCEEGSLKVEVMAKVVNDKIEMDFVISQKDAMGFFTVVAKPHMIADSGIPAMIELKEEAPQERLPVVKQVCNLFGIRSKMVEKSTLKLVVIAQK